MLAEARRPRRSSAPCLELGGYNPLIILDDVDVDYAVRMATFGSFFHQGQICLNTRKIIIQRKIYDEFLDKFVARTKTLPSGDPLDPEHDHRPADHRRRRRARWTSASRRPSPSGATAARPAAPTRAAIFQPTILTDVPYEADRVQRGDVRPARHRRGGRHARGRRRRRQPRQYGLTSSILTGDTYRGFELAPKVLHGIVNVNSPTVNDEIHAPMGGVRDSGWGRTGPDSLADFTDVIWINSHSGQRQYPLKPSIRPATAKSPASGHAGSPRRLASMRLQVVDSGERDSRLVRHRSR